MSIIIEIDGVRHKMVKAKEGTDCCQRCSIRKECKCMGIIGVPCFGKNYFKKGK